MSWYSESEAFHAGAHDELAERYPGEHIEILDTFDLAYAGWECDSQGALITHDGVPELVIIDQVGDSRPALDVLRDRLAEYHSLIAETERVLTRYEQLASESTAVEQEQAFVTLDMQEFLGLDDREYRLIRLKWTIIREIGLMLEDARISEAQLAEAGGFDREQVSRWLRGIVSHATLDHLALLHDAAAELAEMPTLELILRSSE
jgi:hypothetical protein